MRQNNSITQDELKQLMEYNPETGIFIWAISPRSNVRAGSVAGSISSTKHRVICIHKKAYKAHQLVWLCVYGEFANSEIDHINGIRDDNRVENLRKANDSQQKQNVVAYKSNKTGVLGVNYCKRNGKYVAQIQVDGKKIWLGYHDTIELAQIAYDKAKVIYHPYQPVARR